MKARTRTVVKTFMPQFASKVENDLKTNTIRKWPKRVPKVGERISCRMWTGRPYFSKQKTLREGTIIAVLHIQIRKGCIRFPGVMKMSSLQEMTVFAIRDGFNGLREFHDWFLKDGKTEFSGIFIQWRPDKRKGESNLELP
jgi:hypothetical protein